MLRQNHFNLFCFGASFEKSVNLDFLIGTLLSGPVDMHRCGDGNGDHGYGNIPRQCQTARFLWRHEEQQY